MYHSLLLEDIPKMNLTFDGDVVRIGTRITSRPGCCAFFTRPTLCNFFLPSIYVINFFFVLLPWSMGPLLFCLICLTKFSKAMPNGICKWPATQRNKAKVSDLR